MGDNEDQKVAPKLGHTKALFTQRPLAPLYTLETLKGPFHITTHWTFKVIAHKLQYGQNFLYTFGL